MNSTKWITILAFVIFLGSASISYAQEPIRTIFGEEIQYESQHDANRKKGRGVSNLLFGFFEFPKTIVEINRSHGGFAALTWGVIEGWDRWMQREKKGWEEIHTSDTPDTVILEAEFHFQPEYDNRWRVRHIRESY